MVSDVTAKELSEMPMMNGILVRNAVIGEEIAKIIYSRQLEKYAIAEKWPEREDRKLTKFSQA